MKPISRKAGVIAYRQNEQGETEILLISSRKHPGTWVFPVGSIDEGENAQQAARRECVEESGYIVELKDEMEKIYIDDGDVTNEFTFFTAEVVEETFDYEKDRTRKWVKLSELENKITEVFRPLARKFAELV